MAVVLEISKGLLSFLENLVDVLSDSLQKLRVCIQTVRVCLLRLHVQFVIFVQGNAHRILHLLISLTLHPFTYCPIAFNENILLL